jgi:hypothetical protein
MNGYWAGPYTGTNSGRIVVEVDDRGSHFEGCAYAYETGNPQLPSTFAVIRTPDKSRKLKFTAPLLPLHPHTGEPTEWQHIEKLYTGQNVSVPRSANVECEWTDESLSLHWTTDIGTHGSAVLPRGNADKPSTYVPLPITSWQEFKKYVLGLEEYRYIFRGQRTQARLRTPFHRTGRGDMRLFMLQDVPTLHRHLSARTTHFFDLTNPLQLAAFLHLVQHHGYPTPLLDWTYSPFVAAYFAYHGLKSSEATQASQDRKVRIFVFDKKQWSADFVPILSLAARWEHFSVVEPLAIGNERLVPQQALSTFTTVDDIETYIHSRETQEKKYLEIIDLSVRDRDSVIRELRLTGITAASLFPGLDGACEELKERFFRL